MLPFLVCVLLVALWLLGLLLGFPGGAEDALTGTMTAFTLLLIALLKNSERRAERAMQRKLDAITQAMLASRGAANQAGATRELEEAVRLHEEL